MKKSLALLFIITVLLLIFAFPVAAKSPETICEYPMPKEVNTSYEKVVENTKPDVGTENDGTPIADINDTPDTLENESKSENESPNTRVLSSEPEENVKTGDVNFIILVALAISLLALSSVSKKRISFK